MNRSHSHPRPRRPRGRAFSPQNHPRGRLAAALLAAWVAAVLPGGALARQAETPDDPVAALRAEIEAVRAEYGARLTDLERRLAALEGEPAAAAPAGEAGELERLREAARQAATGARTQDLPDDAGAPAPPAGRLNLNRLNPEISMTGIFLGSASDTGREEFEAREFELDVQASLDPFSRTRWTLAFEGEEVEIEEGWVQYSSLPGGLELTAGKFRQRFGPLNRQHLHALPQVDYPLALATYFGEEGLAQTGLSFNWLLPRPWATANEVALEVTDGENEEAFGGESFEDFAVLARVKNFWELDDATWFEWGLSGVAGETAEGGDSRVLGTDFTWHWQPPQRAKYREITWRTELLRAERDVADGRTIEAWGGYTYLEGLLRRNLYAGLRVDRVESPLAPEEVVWGWVPYVTWWQSEYVRLRAEYERRENDLTDESENRFRLQLTWAAGPHKHESY